MESELREESAHFIYVNNEPTYMVKPNGTLKWFKLIPMTVDDLKEFIPAKKA